MKTLNLNFSDRNRDVYPTKENIPYLDNNILMELTNTLHRPTSTDEALIWNMLFDELHKRNIT